MIQDNLIKVGMADLNVTHLTGVLKTTGLGSCVGLTLYDARTKIAGMAHVIFAKLGNCEGRQAEYREICGYGDTGNDQADASSRCTSEQNAGENGGRSTNVRLREFGYDAHWAEECGVL